MSIRQDHSIDKLIINILKNVSSNKYKNHSFGRPFITAYQLAILFEKSHSYLATKIVPSGNLGGQGSGSYSSLAKYLANQISSHYDELKVLGLEGGFISNESVSNMEFEKNITAVDSGISIFRYNDYYVEN